MSLGPLVSGDLQPQGRTPPYPPPPALGAHRRAAGKVPLQARGGGSDLGLLDPNAGPGTGKAGERGRHGGPPVAGRHAGDEGHQGRGTGGGQQGGWDPRMVNRV